MKNYQVRLYQPQDFEIWNAFMGIAKNATFLFNRDFMEYHSDRFEDYSLVVFEGKRIVAALPANRVGSAVFSHQGLSYGGLILDSKSKLSNVIVIFKEILVFLNQNLIETLMVKNIPSFYNTSFSEEMEYCLFASNAKLIRKDTLSVIDLSKEITFDKNRMEGVKKGVKNKLVVREEDTFDSFWSEILIPNLTLKHQAKPVHSLSEISNLKKVFPKNIRQFNVYENDILVAGTTVFINNNVVHSQYISGNETKSSNGSLDFLHHYLIKEVFKDFYFYDFGMSNESEGRKINSGLLFWKESFGSKIVNQAFYEVKTLNYKLLDTILI